MTAPEHVPDVEAIEPEQFGQDRSYRPVCSCGWRGEPRSRAGRGITNMRLYDQARHAAFLHAKHATESEAA